MWEYRLLSEFIGARTSINRRYGRRFHAVIGKKAHGTSADSQLPSGHAGTSQYSTLEGTLSRCGLRRSLKAVLYPSSDFSASVNASAIVVDAGMTRICAPEHPFCDADERLRANPKVFCL